MPRQQQAVAVEVEVGSSMAEEQQPTAENQQRGPIFRAAERFFVAEGWPAVTTAEGIRATVQGNATNSSFPLYVLPREERGVLLCYAVAPNRAPANRRAAAARLACQITYGLHIGVFEYDENDGEARVRTGLDISGLGLFAEGGERNDDAESERVLYGLLAGLVYPAAMILDEYLPAWNAVIDGRTAAQALALVETE